MVPFGGRGRRVRSRGIPRHGYPLQKAGAPLGEVTSGSLAPWLNKPIGRGYVAAANAGLGAAFDVVIRGQPVAARVVPTPFYKRPR